MTIPPEAITAAAEEIHANRCLHASRSDRALALAALEAALPHDRLAQRRRLIATCEAMDPPWNPDGVRSLLTHDGTIEAQLAAQLKASWKAIWERKAVQAERERIRVDLADALDTIALYGAGESACVVQWEDVQAVLRGEQCPSGSASTATSSTTKTPPKADDAPHASEPKTASHHPQPAATTPNTNATAPSSSPGPSRPPTTAGPNRA